MENICFLRGYSSKNFLACLSLRARKSVSSSSSWKIAAACIFFSRRQWSAKARIIASKEYLLKALKISLPSLYWLSGFLSENSFLGLPGRRLASGVAWTGSGDSIKFEQNFCKAKEEVDTWAFDWKGSMIICSMKNKRCERTSSESGKKIVKSRSATKLLKKTWKKKWHYLGLNPHHSDWNEIF